MGLNDMPEYWAYYNAMKRCKDLKDPYYGGRGIRFLFSSFKQFYNEIGPKPAPSVMLDRVDNEKGYEPGNVRWVTTSESRRNQRITPKKIAHLNSIAKLGGKRASESGQAATIAHIRWHVKRGITKGDCNLCSIQKLA